MSGWFPRLRADGVIASGDAGIWLTHLDGLVTQRDTVGIKPVWAGRTLVYNRNDGTTQVGDDVLKTAYNDYVGSDTGQWAGFLAGAGAVQRYHGTTPIGAAIPVACSPRFYGASFGWLAPYQAPDSQRTLVIDDAPVAHGAIIDWHADKGGGGYVYAMSTGTYTKQLYDHKGQNVTIRPQQDELPRVVFGGPDGSPWVLSETPNSGTFVRNIYAAFGYVIPGDLYYPDARMLDERLHVFGSLNNGTPREVWIDFNPAKRIDLRTL